MRLKYCIHLKICLEIFLIHRLIKWFQIGLLKSTVLFVNIELTCNLGVKKVYVIGLWDDKGFSYSMIKFAMKFLMQLNPDHDTKKAKYSYFDNNRIDHQSHTHTRCTTWSASRYSTCKAWHIYVLSLENYYCNLGYLNVVDFWYASL